MKKLNQAILFFMIIACVPAFCRPTQTVSVNAESFSSVIKKEQDKESETKSEPNSNYTVIQPAFCNVSIGAISLIPINAFESIFIHQNIYPKDEKGESIAEITSFSPIILRIKRSIMPSQAP